MNGSRDGESPTLAELAGKSSAHSDAPGL